MGGTPGGNEPRREGCRRAAGVLTAVGHLEAKLLLPSVKGRAQDAQLRTDGGHGSNASSYRFNLLQQPTLDRKGKSVQSGKKKGRTKDGKTGNFHSQGSEVRYARIRPCKFGNMRSCLTRRTQT